MYRVIIVDDEAEIRKGLQLKINWEACGFRIVGEAANGRRGPGLHRTAASRSGHHRHPHAFHGRDGTPEEMCPRLSRNQNGRAVRIRRF